MPRLAAPAPLGSHWDTHDVFAVQLIGRKHWRVYEPTFAMPLPTQRSKDRKHECPAVPVFDGVLEAGDIPRGWWHSAEPIPGEETYHIAAGVHTAKTIDYLSWLVEHILPDFVACRTSLLGNSDDGEKVEQLLQAIAAAAHDQGNLEKFMAGIHGLRNTRKDVSFAGIIPNPVREAA
ncbi:JmjC domain-containing protein [Pseudoduganella chitinolytica]|uniref:Cupin domain-containing protein n=1 Tax=Pseudoduganella chitinolytica TaxID=34070 RepID=A0ABY8BGZ7_9BURK|nr:cupin domain-containing protein [Pseudoduganella chitinolytica]WEF35202.1 cupin domain-containing protein [Pseudoduganella chitinolytica]